MKPRKKEVERCGHSAANRIVRKMRIDYEERQGKPEC
jgi:hypothetical protein